MENIKCEKLSFTYPKSESPALTDISFEICTGEFCLLTGKSGAGKSTLLKLLKKEIAPFGSSDGSITINAQVGFVSQNVEESIVCDKVRSELSFALTNKGMSGGEIELLVAETASYFNIENKLDCDISTLSGGEKQIVNLAAVMITKPDILLLDEPMSQLDPIASQKFITVIKRLHRDFSTTILISEHSCDDLFDHATNIMLIDSGRLLLKSSPEKMVEYLKDTHSDMINSIPVYLRLYDGAKTVSQCRDVFRQKNAQPVQINSEADEIAIKLRGVYFAYDRGCDILNDLSLNIYKGRINAIVGPNSSGKSTLLKVICRVLKSYRGKIRSGDLKISMLSQNVFDLFTHEKCSDEVSFGEITDFLSISDIKDKHPYDLSGGQAQRLALAMVLEQNADVILLDEPTSALDCECKARLATILKDLCSMGKTIIIVSHDIEFVGTHCDQVSFLSRGRIITTARRREFFSNLSFYTTAISKITSPIVKGIVSYDDLIQSGGMQ